MFAAIDTFDLAMLNWLRQFHTPWLDALMIWISASGGGGLVWVTLGVLALMRPRDRAAAWRVMLALALSYALVDGVMKPLVARSRPASAVVRAGQAAEGNVNALSPKRDLPPLPATSSFPSGHATSTFSAAVTVSRMWPQTRVVWWSLAVLIGYSRIYLGHHYPLDVLGGALFGTLIAFWVLGGRHRATYASTLPRPLPPGIVVRP